MCRRSLGLMALMTAALLAGVATLVDLPTGIARLAGALALVLILPGYSLTKLLPVRLQALRWARFVFTIGLSLAADVLGGLVLNLTPWGIGREGLVIWLCSVTLMAGGVVLVRPQAGSRVASPDLSFSLRGAALLVAATVAATMAVALAHWGATQVSSPDTTQLWLLANNQAGAGGVRLGVRNLETTARSYQLAVVSGDKVLFEWRSITLSPSEIWQVDLDIPADEARSPTVEARLYVAHSDAAYRHAVLWRSLPSSGSPPSLLGIQRFEPSERK
ncbi:MAG: DUF1616 domain-containing protein [Chloroflexi bacterium]|nr:DUF1616 domain-containing protein [Chloroflexota bacterium]